MSTVTLAKVSSRNMTDTGPVRQNRQPLYGRPRTRCLEQGDSDRHPVKRVTPPSAQEAAYLVQLSKQTGAIRHFYDGLD